MVPYFMLEISPDISLMSPLAASQCTHVCFPLNLSVINFQSNKINTSDRILKQIMNCLFFSGLPEDIFCKKTKSLTVTQCIGG